MLKRYMVRERLGTPSLGRIIALLDSFGKECLQKQQKKTTLEPCDFLRGFKKCEKLIIQRPSKCSERSCAYFTMPDETSYLS